MIRSRPNVSDSNRSIPKSWASGKLMKRDLDLGAIRDQGQDLDTEEHDHNTARGLDLILI